MTLRHVLPVLGLSALILGGCAANPKVVYSPITGPDEKGAVKFRLAHSVIKFDVTRAAADAGAAKGTPGPISGYTIASVPVSQSTDQAYSVADAGLVSNIGVSTALTVKLRPDSDLIQQVGVKITDQRVTLINNAATLVTGVLGLLAAEAPGAPPPAPPQIDVSAQLADPNACTRGDGGIDGPLHCTVDDTGFVVVVDYGPVPKDAFPVSTLNKSYSSNSYVYAACRDATVKLLYGPADSAVGQLPTKYTPQLTLPVATVKVSDPRWLQSLAFPASGSVSAADSCGAASTSDGAAAGSNGLDIANALVKAAQSIKDANKPAAPAAKPAAGAAKPAGG